MDTESVRQNADIIFAGMTKGEFIAVLILGGILVAFLMWWLNRPSEKMQATLDKLMERVKTPEELEDHIENSVLKHTVACEGKALMPRVLNCLDKNTQVIQEHSHATHAMTEAAHALTDAVHTLKQRSI